MTHLCLRIGTSPAENSRATEVSDFLVQAMGKDDGERHAFLSFVSCVAEHQTLWNCDGVSDESISGLHNLIDLQQKSKT